MLIQSSSYPLKKVTCPELFLLFSSFSLRKSASSYRLRRFAVVVAFQDMGCFARNRLGCLLSVCHGKFSFLFRFVAGFENVLSDTHLLHIIIILHIGVMSNGQT